MMALPSNEQRRAVATAGLLASDKDGEALAATRALCRLLDKHGLSPAVVVAAGLAVAPSREPEPALLSTSHQRLARMALSFTQLLTDWEVEFLQSITRLRTISPKQWDRLNAIKDKLDRRTA